MPPFARRGQTNNRKFLRVRLPYPFLTLITTPYNMDTKHNDQTYSIYILVHSHSGGLNSELAGVRSVTQPVGNELNLKNCRY